MKYKIVGNKRINNKEPGEVIELKDPFLEQSLIDGGHLEKVKGSVKKKGKNAEG